MATEESSPLLSTLQSTADQTDTDHPQLQPDETDRTMSTLLWKTGAIFGATAVGLGAFGAHGLKKRISDPSKLANWSTAAQYQVFTHLRSRPSVAAGGKY